MAIPRYMEPSYLGAMDRGNYYTNLDVFGPVHAPGNIVPQEGIQSGLSTLELGTTLNPMQNQLQALQAKIREGASKVEFEFAGAQKGNSQASTPESYGREEREMMRHIAHINNIRSSTHATFNVSGLAGFGQRGFSKEQQHRTVHEVERAIDFAKDATTGGAIVVHTGEWKRPVSHHYGQDGMKNQFRQFEEEDKEATLLVVDEETGDIIENIRKDRVIHVPDWHTAKSLGEKHGKVYTGTNKKNVLGEDVAEIKDDDYVDQNGNYIDPNDVEQLFRRMPVYDKDGVQFKARAMSWNDLVEETKWFNDKYGKNLAPEVYYAQLQFDNRILQAKGSSLYHGRMYDRESELWVDAAEALEYWEEIEEGLPDDQKYQLMEQKFRGKMLPAKTTNLVDDLRELKRQQELSMRYTHQASSSADAQAAEFIRKRDHLRTVEEYGLEQTGKALARLAEQAMDATSEAKKMRKGTGEHFEDLFIAPENWHPSDYGSHPDELLNIVIAGREEFKNRLREHRGITDEDKLQQLAENHIKTTFDIGHLNMWRAMLKRNENESEEKFQQRFNKWIFGHLEKLHDAKAIGHLHLTDNFGYNDEHLSLGQGNTPVKEFVQWMADRGYGDFIIEPGSYNATTIMADAWSYLGATNWYRGGIAGIDQTSNFAAVRHSQAALYAPPNYIVGSFVPSNEWTLWSQVPLE